MVDRRNHHLFQPLLYQVATAALHPGTIAAPIRSVVSGQKNCRVLMNEVKSIDLEAREIELDDAFETFIDEYGSPAKAKQEDRNGSPS